MDHGAGAFPSHFPLHECAVGLSLPKAFLDHDEVSDSVRNTGLKWVSLSVTAVDGVLEFGEGEKRGALLLIFCCPRCWPVLDRQLSSLHLEPSRCI